MDNIKRVDFTTHYCNSDGEPIMKADDISVIYNTDVISEEEVDKLIDTGKYQYDSRVVVTTQERADNMKGPKAHPINMYQYSTDSVKGFVFAETEKEAWKILKNGFSAETFNNIKKLYCFCDNVKNGLTVTTFKEE